tara:strand:+ start:1226 stop:1573 length:348 start_codon:yes stop_codon:yes gene_type:complete
MKGINNRSNEFPKLVRDNIPSIIKKSGKECVCNIDKDPIVLTGWLAKKVIEELEEYRRADSANKLEEAADMYEVCMAIWSLSDLKLEDIQAKAEEKRKLRGGFEEGIILWDIFDK